MRPVLVRIEFASMRRSVSGVTNAASRSWWLVPGSWVPVRIASTTDRRRRAVDAFGRDTVARSDDAVVHGGVLEGSNNGRADRDDSTAAARAPWRSRSPSRRECGTAPQAAIVCRAHRRRSTKFRRRCVIVAKPMPRCMQTFDGSPAQHETGRRRLKGYGRTGDDGPHIPQRQRFGDVRVLNRSAVMSDSRPDRVGGSVEFERRSAADARGC